MLFKRSFWIEHISFSYYNYKKDLLNCAEIWSLRKVSMVFLWICWLQRRLLDMSIIYNATSFLSFLFKNFIFIWTYFLGKAEEGGLMLSSIINFMLSFFCKFIISKKLYCYYNSFFSKISFF